MSGEGVAGRRKGRERGLLEKMLLAIAKRVEGGQ
jgi:hypothetical protein